MKDYDIVDPRAEALVPGIRDIGYNLETAVADLVDNSITADARKIGLEFRWSGEESWIAVIDDGKGMDEHTLISAMRLGSSGPLEEREIDDLGRFGLGLKTASFSVCKSITVLSKMQGGNLEVARWDIDDIIETGEWRLYRSPTAVGETLTNFLAGCTSGTIVLWEKLDRVVGDALVVDDKMQNFFNEEGTKVQRHLEMVFHRFLEEPGSLVMTLNEMGRQAEGRDSGTYLEPWDPFLSSHPFTAPQDVTPLDNGKIQVQPYILPHFSHFEGLDEAHRLAGGINGWNAQQGFYIYRNKRMLVAGDWLGLFGKDEHVKLARIKVDLPNDLDLPWSLDVKKSRVIIPVMLRPAFRAIAGTTRKLAEGIYRARGAREVITKQGAWVPLWQEKQVKGIKKTYWVVNPDHPLVKEVRESLPNQARRNRFADLMKLVSANIPVQSALIAQSEKPEGIAAPMSDVTVSKKISIARRLLNVYIGQGYPIPDAIDAICTEFFPGHIEIRQALESVKPG